jgi:hypothetical protein
MDIYKKHHKILLEREKILFSKINRKLLTKLSVDDVESIIRITYIWGEPLWGKNSYFGNYHKHFIKKNLT